MIARRDAIIALDWVHGSTFAELATRWGISVGRAAQIKDRVFKRIGEPKWFRGSAVQRAPLIGYKIRLLCDARELADTLNFSTPMGHWNEVEMEKERDSNRSRISQLESKGA